MGDQQIFDLIECTKNMNLLYVEDNELTRQTTTLMLEGFFANIVQAVDGIDGIEKFDTLKFDLVITDINMPRASGLELATHIKNKNPKIPVLVFSAHNETDYFVDSIRIGVDGFLLKPVELDQVISLLEKVTLNIKNQKAIAKLEQLQRKTEKHEALKTMLHNITHHWRQPLNAITAAAGTLEMFNTINEQNKSISKSLDTINQSAMLLSKMLDDFQMIFQYGATRDHFTSLVKIIDLIKSEFQSQIEFDCDLQIDQIKIDQDILYSTIKPLIMNIIEVQNHIQKRVKIDSFIENKNIVITLLDNAGGIDQSNLEKIYEPYFTTHHQYFGKGLGLFFVSNIIQNYLDGTIDIVNKVYNLDHSEVKGVLVKISIPKENHESY
ncbi:MAG: hybrid sensor histidine kinase/response regulator [Campylobacterales bacterium]|nr:hybrid sensor histidine kinase/response regulator [Campylobacterales bacterium]